MNNDATEIALRLGQQAEALCRHYLSNGRRTGNYWQVGDVRNTPGRSMFVRLKNSVERSPIKNESENALILYLFEQFYPSNWNSWMDIALEPSPIKLDRRGL